ncbi:MAG: hypothetical protein IT361_08250 [Gemmatimonadaceae bacterium]|nr:hypothetical protein [Gemmatimonadaceae bacterium]
MSAHNGNNGPDRAQIAAMISKPGPKGLRTIALALAVVGFAVFVAGAAMGEARAWQAFHVNWLFFTIPASAAVMLAAVQRITTARWSRSVIRLLEGFVAWMPIALVLLLVTVFLGKGHIFPWVSEHIAIPEKALWLNTTFWSARVILVYALLTGLSLWYVRSSVRLDVALLPEWGAAWARGLRDGMRRGFGEERRELHTTHSRQGKAAVFLAILFGFGWTMLAWDLSMSMDYHFQSTMYGWQVFMGGWLVALMAFALLARAWRNYLGLHEVITETQLHDIGKLCFAFTAFWGYLTFSQYLVIWFGNMGEETHYLRLRLIAPWANLSVAVALMVFLLPFLGLMGKFPKLYAPTMSFFALSAILGMWLHRYLEIYPNAHLTATTAPFGIWEVGTTVGFFGLFAWSYLMFMEAFPRLRVVLMTSPYRDEMQVPVDPRTMEPLPAHE